MAMRDWKLIPDPQGDGIDMAQGVPAPAVDPGSPSYHVRPSLSQVLSQIALTPSAYPKAELDRLGLQFAQVSEMVVFAHIRAHLSSVVVLDPLWSSISSSAVVYLAIELFLKECYTSSTAGALLQEYASKINAYSGRSVLILELKSRLSAPAATILDVIVDVCVDAAQDPQTYQLPDLNFEISTATVLVVTSAAKKGNATQEWVRRFTEDLKKHVSPSFLFTPSTLAAFYGHYHVHLVKALRQVSEEHMSNIPSIRLRLILERSRGYGLTGATLVANAMREFRSFPWKLIIAKAAGEWAVLLEIKDLLEADPYFAHTPKASEYGMSRYKTFAYTAVTLKIKVGGEETLRSFKMQARSSQHSFIDGMIAHYIEVVCTLTPDVKQTIVDCTRGDQDPEDVPILW